MWYITYKRINLNTDISFWPESLSSGLDCGGKSPWLIRLVLSASVCWCVFCGFNRSKEMKFRGEWHFLSNMFPCLVTWDDGLVYKSSETIYQMMKCEDREERKRFLNMDGYQAKKAGRHVILSRSWNEIKDAVMWQVLMAKFDDKMLGSMLIDTGNIELIEDNHWGDTYWGRCNGKGQNKLGIMLMEVREELAK